MRTEPVTKVKTGKGKVSGKRIQLVLALVIAFVSVFFFLFKILFF